LLALKNVGGRIHYYGFVHVKKDEDTIEKATGRVQDRLNSLATDFEARALAFGRIVRTTGPNWFQVVLDIRVGCPTSKRSET
jgi:tRNA G37 N-methylase Trm5